MSWTADAPWPWGAPIASVTLTVGGVSISVTWSTNDSSLSFSAEFPTPCDPVPVKLKMCWESGYCQDVPLGLKEGYEVVETHSSTFSVSATASLGGSEICPDDTWHAGGSLGLDGVPRRTMSFVAPCHGMTNNYLSRIDRGHTEQCFAGKPAYSDFHFIWENDWWSATNTVYQPDRGLRVGIHHWDTDAEGFVVYTLDDYTASLTFRAPSKYGKDTAVVLTFENLSYEALLC